MTSQAPWTRPPRRPRLSDDAAEYVRELIVSNGLKAGDYLRPEKLADEMGISATPMREGLLTLQAQGLVRVEPRRGFVVAPISSSDIEDVFAGQALLGGELAARAATRMASSETAVLASVQAALEQAAGNGDFDEVERLNHEFHRRIYQAAAAPKLWWMIRASVAYAPRRFFAQVAGWPQASAADHRAIIAALEQRDAEAARAAMAAHLHGAGALLAAHRAESER